MNNFLKQLESERAALIRKRDLALNRKRGFQERLDKLHTDLKDAEHRLRVSKRAALTGGTGRLPIAAEAEIVTRLTEGPVEDAALQDVLQVEDGKIAEIDAEIHAKEREILHARMDEVEAGLLERRLDDLRRADEKDANGERSRNLLDTWEGLERNRRALNDSAGRYWFPHDHPDRFSRTPTGIERPRPEHRAAVQERLQELEARMDGRKEPTPSLPAA
jgi:hypothetical protein